MNALPLLMGDFRKDLDKNWWFHATGKGNKNRTITVCNDMINALKRYRKSLGLSQLPGPGEQIPLIAKSKGKGSITRVSNNLGYEHHANFTRSFKRMCGISPGIQEYNDLITNIIN